MFTPFSSFKAFLCETVFFLSLQFAVPAAGKRQAWPTAARFEASYVSLHFGSTSPDGHTHSRTNVRLTHPLTVRRHEKQAHEIQRHAYGDAHLFIHKGQKHKSGEFYDKLSLYLQTENPFLNWNTHNSELYRSFFADRYSFKSPWVSLYKFPTPGFQQFSEICSHTVRLGGKRLWTFILRCFQRWSIGLESGVPLFSGNGIWKTCVFLKGTTHKIWEVFGHLVELQKAPFCAISKL